MTKLREIYNKNIDREIQGVIKVDDESFISQELEEYVVTDEILKHLRKFFEAYNLSLNGRTEHMGVWISGFFGSGKSHFLKILSYILDNKEVVGKKAVEYFDNKINDKKLLEMMYLAGNISTDVILFNIDSKASLDNITGKDRILSVFEKVFNEKLGLSTIPHVAELERYLIKNNKYDSFKEIIEKDCNEEWKNIRNDFYFRRDEIVKAYSLSLNKSMEEAENWFDKAEDMHDISIEKFAERIKEYVEKTGDNHHVVFLIDEVGQYIGNDRQALLNLQTIVEDLGTACNGRVWVCVTSQEAIDEVVKVHSDEFSKIQGRFDTRLSLSSTDTDEVIKRRILEKKEEAQESLKLLYEKEEPIIKNLFQWKKAQTQKSYVDASDFAITYPFIPYQFKMLQDVFTDIRTKGFAGKHLSSGERSLLGAFQETAKRYGESEIGILIPFYAFYDTIEQFLEGTVKRVFQNAINIMKNGNLKEIDINVLKILFMLKNIDYIPTNIENIAILYTSSINEDRLQLKKEIEQSLSRLEKETLIQRTNEEYKFLTDDEQEINREIKKVIVDQNAIKEALKGLIYDYTLTDRKFTYKNNPFDLTLYLDDTKVSARESEIGVKVITTTSDKNDTEIFAGSMREPNLVYVLLEIDPILDAELYNVLQVESYVRNTSRINKSAQVDAIIRAKNTEANATRTRIKDAIYETLKSSDILISGDKQLIHSKEPVLRVREGLEKLINNTYSKLNYIETNFNQADIKELFHENRTQQMQGLKVAFANQKAYDAMRDYLLEKNSFSYNVTIRTLLQDFSKAPYGYREEDILYILTKLLKDEIINLEYFSEIQSVNSEDTLIKILRRDYYEKTIVKIREKIDQKLINDARDLATYSFDRVMPEDEDGIVKLFTETLSDKVFELSGLLGKYNIVSKYKYPGQSIIEETIELLRPISKIKNPTDFFETISSQKEQIKENMELIKEIIEFFKGSQKTNFDQARISVEIYDNNKDYADESTELTEAVKNITDILYMEEPYGEIYKLPNLRSTLNDILIKMYDKKAEPIKANANNVINYIDNEVERTKINAPFVETIKNQLHNTINSLDNSNELQIIYAKAKYIEDLKEEFIEKLDEEIKKIELNNIKESSSDEKISNIIKRKNIKIDSLLNKSYEINNEEDIDKYLAELKTKLMEELKNNNNITIR